MTADAGRLSWLLAAVLVGLYIGFGRFLASHTHGRLWPGDAPIFYDFSAFYQAGTFANQGHAAAAYDDARMIAAEHAAFPGTILRLPWNYPPTFQLALMPLAALPYLAAWLAWSLATFGLYAVTTRQLFEPRRFCLVALAPAAPMNLMMGQNGLLTTAMMGMGVLLLPRRPILAGVVLGLLAYKPQFAVVAPLALLAGREWRALAAAAISQTAIMALAAAVLGVDVWIAFAHKAIQPAAVFTSSSSSWRTIPSIMVFARTLGLPAVTSSVLHWTMAAFAAAGALWIWTRSEDAHLRVGGLAAATLLVTPYLRTYDLVLLSLAIAALAPRKNERGKIMAWAVIAAAWMVPAVLWVARPQVQYGALVTVTVMGMLVWRCSRQSRGADVSHADALAQRI
jgi:hypothetical protein